MTCALPRCGNEPVLVYYGKDVCEKHWLEHCAGKIDLKALLKIDESGQMMLR